MFGPRRQAKRNARRGGLLRGVGAGVRAAAGWAKPRLRESWRLWPMALFAALVGLVWHQMHHADYFRLARIDVPTCQHVDKNDLLGFLHTRLGQNIFSIDLDLLAQRVVSYPWVKSAVVRRQLPNRLVVGITERRAIALLHSDRSYLVDEDGVAFKHVEEGDPVDLPVFTGFSIAAFAAGGATAQREAERLAGAAQLMRLCQRLGVFEEQAISEIRYDLLTGYSLITTDAGLIVRFGHGDYEAKIKNFQRVARSLDARLSQVRMVDLAVDGRVVVRGLRKGTGA
jgi:cell division protein FtsQ